MDASVGYIISESPWSLTEHGRKAELKLKSNVYDLEAWSILIREAQTTAATRAQVFYERLVHFFPTSGRYWRLYIEQEIRNKNYEEVEKLFQRCLMTVLNLDLWKCYISYVKETKSSLRTFRDKMRQTYEFALDHIGMDYHATPLWSEYISFLKTEDAQGAFGENQKVQNIRNAYHRAVVMPLMNLESLWREYNLYENTVDKPNAKRHVEQVSRQYVNAKRCSQELEGVTRGLIRGGTSVPLRGTPQEVQQLQIWKRYISWEKSNPTRTEDQSVLVKRVLYSHEQCLLCFGHCADIWYEAALYLQRASETGDPQCGSRWSEEASIMFDRAVNGPLKSNLLIHFAYADFEELRQKHDNAEAIYTKLLEKKDLDPTLVYVQYMKFARRAQGIKGARSIFKRAREDPRTGNQVFVAAAHTEYYVSKDDKIPLKILDLGMKKFSDNPKYILAYLEFLAHKNEDNNTRVLFEKAISSMTQDKTSEIWEKFVEFESTVGDLATLIKVERRRSLTIKTEETRSRDTVMLVDRYKFLDLLPCTDVELKLIGHPASKLPCTNGGSNFAINAFIRSSDSPGNSFAMQLRDSNIIKPDVTQMAGFKPSATSGVGMNYIPGGTFPLPSAVSNLLSRLPPPESFHGPFVKIDEFLSNLEAMELGQNFQAVSGQDGEAAGEKPAGKRKREGVEEEEDLLKVPPVNDIYRSRQQKRVHVA